MIRSVAVVMRKNKSKRAREDEEGETGSSDSHDQTVSVLRRREANQILKILNESSLHHNLGGLISERSNREIAGPVPASVPAAVLAAVPSPAQPEPVQPGTVAQPQIYVALPYP